MFWWYLVAWIARHYLRRAEEECCDAWVVWTLPTHRRSYGRALMKTVEFSAERPRVLQVVSSAFGQFVFKRRIEMILKREMSPQTSRWVWIAVLLGAVVVLPVAAQSVRTGDTEEVPRASGVEVGDRALPTDRNANDAVPKGDLLDFLAAAGSDDGKPTEEPANKGEARAKACCSLRTQKRNNSTA